MPATPANRSASDRVLEVCVGSLADAQAAAAAGADRLELCGALELGGLTPSIGLIELVVEAAGVPVVVMVRPRAGGFAYSDDEFACLRLDAERALAAGAAGVVFGLLDHHGQIDAERTAAMASLATSAGRDAVFHRAFDAVAHQPEAIETLVATGMTRVLTSGGAATATEGAHVLQRLVEAAAGRIEVLAGGGIAAKDVAPLLAATGCRQLHLGAAVGRHDGSVTPAASAALCDLRRLSAGSYRAVDPKLVTAAVAALRPRGES